MKQLALLILLVCWVFDDNIVFVKSESVKSNSTEDSNHGLIAILKNICRADNVTLLHKSISDGCMNNNYHYETNKGEKIFVKSSTHAGASKMFHGEYESLKAIYATKTVTVPKPITIGTTDDEQHFIVMSHFENMTKLTQKCWGHLGSQLADLHLHNIQQKDSKKVIKRFGFHIETSIGVLPQNNSWVDDWITFFTENRMGYSIQLLKNSSNSKNAKKVLEYWPEVKKLIPKFFKGITVKPSLLHGDFWVGNIDESKFKPILYDPASFYGHHEFDVALTTLFGGHYQCFFREYFEKIPKHKEYGARKTLYHAYHYLNHWNQFGNQYSDSTVRAFRKVIKYYKSVIPEYKFTQT